MALSRRLQAIADLVRHSSVCDIGSDHALIPISLVKSGRVKHACAVEINERPYLISLTAVRDNGLSDKIKVLKGDGLLPVENKYGTAVIAGMGGMLIIEILKAAPDKAYQFSQLILQPQLDVYELRKFLVAGGFFIEDEYLLLEDGLFYNIIDVTPGKKYSESPYADVEYRLGRRLIEKKDSKLKEFIIGEIASFNKIISGISASMPETEGARARIDELARFIRDYEEVLSCL